MIVVEGVTFEQPKTKEMARILGALGINSSALIVTAEPDINLYKSARNLEKIKTLPANLLNVVDLLSHKILMITVAGVKGVEEIWAPGERKERAVKASISGGGTEE